MPNKIDQTIDMTNAFIAHKLGCDVRTVVRWTERLVKMGFIKKQILSRPYFGIRYTTVKNYGEGI